MTSSLLFNVTTIAYMASMVVFFAFIASKNKSVGLAGSMIAYAGFIIQTVAIGLRWKESYDMGVGHAPLSNLYESVGLFFVDHHPDLCLHRHQVQVPGRGGICRPLACWA